MTTGAVAQASGRTWALVAAAIAGLTLLGFFQFPGHTYLQSDTQIYLPILEHLRDPNLFAKEILATDPHVSFTIYDEAALVMRRATGLDFHAVLVAQQLLFRALGLLGVYLIAASLGLRAAHALLATAVFSAGATIIGPAVLTIEYEPVPRGFAIPLLILAIGLVAHGRDLAAGSAGALAFLYHPPSVLPFWTLYFALTLWPARPLVMRRRILGLAPLAAAVLVLFALSRMQAGVSEPQAFFSRLTPELERLQRLRSSYNWISQWPPGTIVQYVFLSAVALAAYWRIRRHVPQDLRIFLAGLPLLGLASLPATYILLEHFKWSVIPQIQPARSVLFIVVAALVAAGAAAVKAVEARRYWESLLWLMPAFAVTINTLAIPVFLPTNPLLRGRLLLVFGLALFVTAAAWAITTKRLWRWGIWAAACIVPSFVVPAWGHVVNYPRLDSPDLAKLSSWARASTPEDAVFFFPDAGRALTPGIFRADALRAVYVDWKGGGQANFLRNFAREWWRRWMESDAAEFTKPDMDLYRALGIDYIVLENAHRISLATPEFENARFVVYRTAATPQFPNTSERYETIASRVVLDCATRSAGRSFFVRGESRRAVE